MFSIARRDSVRARLLELAAADPSIAAAATTGSYAFDAADAWSDIDLAFGIRGDLRLALERWTGLLDAEFGLIHHWDLAAGPSIYRVFLLADRFEVDLGFTPEAQFGGLGPNWRLAFGGAVELAPSAPPAMDVLVGHAWHHALHANASIGRGQAWQAEHWISRLRDQVIELASLRAGVATAYAKGAHLLPANITGPLEAALVQSLDEPELRRALAVAIAALDAELQRYEPVLAARLRPMLRDLAAEQSAAQPVEPDLPGR